MTTTAWGKRKTRRKSVRGYALLDGKSLLEVFPLPTREEAMRHWEHEFEDLGYNIIPCMISYLPPRSSHN